MNDPVDNKRPARTSLFALLPKRSLAKAVLLLLMLLAVLVLQRRSGSISRALQDSLMPPGSPASNRDGTKGRSVRMAPPASAPNESR